MEASVTKKKNVIIDYPGVVVSVENMLKTLGGEANISKVYNDPMMRLDMKMRPDDVFCKPACADRLTTHSLLLKVTQKPTGPDGAGDTENTASSRLDAEVLGIAETEYRFESLADFQYLAMKTKEDGSGYESFYNRIVPSRTEKIQTDFLEDKNAPLFLPSPIYSRMDHPSEYAYKDRPESKQQKQTQPEGIITLDRAKRPQFSKFHSFKAGAVPTEPYTQAMQRYNSKPHPAELNYLKRLQDLFKERPLWTKIAVASVTGYGREILKQALPLVAYYWDTGPWRTMWCVYGFDPRKEPSAKVYQLIDFRLKGRMFSDINIKRSATKAYNLPPTIQRSGAGPSAATIRHSDLVEPQSVSKTDTNDLEKLWKFRPNVLPTQRQFFYQLIDIEMPEVQELVHANDGQESECTERDGWCLEHTADKIRKKMSAAVIKFVEREHAKDPSGQSLKATLPESSWEKLKPYHNVKLWKKKGKSGPRHRPKGLASRTEPISSDNVEIPGLDSRLAALDVAGGDSEQDIPSSDSDSDYNDRDLDTSPRELRTRKEVIHQLGDDLPEKSDIGEEIFTDSDDDPEYNPAME